MFLFIVVVEKMNKQMAVVVKCEQTVNTKLNGPQIDARRKRLAAP